MYTYVNPRRPPALPRDLRSVTQTIADDVAAAERIPTVQVAAGGAGLPLTRDERGVLLLRPTYRRVGERVTEVSQWPK